MLSSKHLLRVLIGMTLIGVLAAGCGDPPPPSSNQDNNQNNQANATNNANDNDGNNDEGAGPIEDPDDDCEAAVDRNVAFDIPAPDDAEAVGVPDLTRVGDELWLAFLAVVEMDGEEFEKAYLVRLDCGGEAIDDPEPLGTADATMEGPPSLGTDGSVVYATWIEVLEVDDGGETVEVPVSWLQPFETDGTPMVGEPLQVQVDIDGEDDPLTYVEATDVAVNHDSHAVVVGQQVEDMESRAWLQRIDEQGEADGPGFYLEPDATESQFVPAVSIRDDNFILFAFLEESGWGEGEARHGTVHPGGYEPDEGPTAAEADLGGEGAASTSVDISKSAAGGNVWMTYTRGLGTNNTVRVRSGNEVGVVETEGAQVDGRQSSSPVVAASDTGGAVAWFSTDGETGEVHFRRIEGAAAAITDAGPVIDLGEDSPATGGPDLVWITDHIYAVVWPEGDEFAGQTIDFERLEDG